VKKVAHEFELLSEIKKTYPKKTIAQWAKIRPIWSPWCWPRTNGIAKLNLKLAGKPLFSGRVGVGGGGGWLKHLWMEFNQVHQPEILPSHFELFGHHGVLKISLKTIDHRHPGVRRGAVVIASTRGAEVPGSNLGRV
jgi:hypothetical protein